MERLIPLVRRGKFFVADVGPAKDVKEIFVSDASASFSHVDSEHCVVAIPVSVPQAGKWTVKIDCGTVMASPPSGGMHWVGYTLTIFVPKGCRIRLYTGM